MIMLCERCFAPIALAGYAVTEPVVRLFSPADGGVRWGYRYQHLGGSPRCVLPRLVAPRSSRARARPGAGHRRRGRPHRLPEG